MNTQKTALSQTVSTPVSNPPVTYPRKNSALFLTTLLGIGMTLAASSAQATNWQYLSGGYDPANGQPIGMTDKSSVMPTNLLATILARLPEGQSAIGKNTTTLGTLTDDKGANVFLKANANVKISYITEGAGYLNSVGFFKFAKTALTTLPVSSVIDTIIFPNFSDNVLQFGQAVDLGNFVAGDAIGFTIAANGWMPGKLIKAAVPAVYSTGITNPNLSVNNIYRTIKRFNPELTATQQAHTILFAYPEKELMILGFEDLNRTNCPGSGCNSDDDFNDVIIAIHVSPFSSVDCADCNQLITPPVCIAPKVLNKNTNTCETPPPVCTAPKVLNPTTNLCEDPACPSPQVRNPTTSLCEEPACPAPQVRNPTTNLCEDPVVVCTKPQVRIAATNKCVTPVTGESGPMSWREITMPDEVTDTNAAAKAAKKSAKDTAVTGQ